MKNILILLVIFLCPLIHAQNSQVVELFWTGQPVTTGYSGPCPGAANDSNCLVGWILSDITNPLKPVLYPTLPMATLQYDIPFFPKSGNRVYSISVQGIDSSGNPQMSDTITATVVVPGIAIIWPTSIQILNKGP